MANKIEVDCKTEGRVGFDLKVDFEMSSNEVAFIIMGGKPNSRRHIHLN